MIKNVILSIFNVVKQNHQFYNNKIKVKNK